VCSYASAGSGAGRYYIGKRCRPPGMPQRNGNNGTELPDGSRIGAAVPDGLALQQARGFFASG